MKRYKITLGRSLASIKPAPSLEFLLSVMTYRRTAFERSRTGYRFNEVPVPLCEMKGKYYHFPLGLVPEVQELLVAAGQNVEIVDERDTIATEIEGCGLGDFTTCTTSVDSKFAEAIRRSDCGQILVDDKADLLAKIASVCGMFPRAQILIAVSNKAQADTVLHHLKSDAPLSASLYHSEWGGTCAARIAVRRLSPNARARIDPRDIVLIADARRSLGLNAVEQLMRRPPRCRRVYSFVPSLAELTHDEMKLLTAISGPIIFRPDRQRSAIKYVMLGSSTQRRITSKSGREFKQVAYWNNAHRNKLVARLAQAFAAKDRKKIESLGLWRCSEAFASEGCTTSILVESTDHAQALQRLLPEWKTMSVLDGEHRGSKKRRSPGQIVTVRHVEQFGVPSDVVIVASGAPASMRIPRIPRLDTLAGTKPVLFIDLADEGDARCQQAADERQEAAARRRWMVHAVDTPTT